MTTGPGDPAVRTDRPGRADDRAAARPRPAPQGPPVTRSENAARPARRKVDLTRFAWLSIAAAITTITLKAGAWALTGSVGLLSDAAESVVNLVAAVVALIALRVAIRPATERFLYGRAKAEYFSAAVEGVMIFAAAGEIGRASCRERV